VAKAVYTLLVDATDIKAAFSIWRSALTEQADWRGDSWWLPEERIVVGNRNDRTTPQLGEFVVLGTDPTGANVTVQLNEPQQYGNENPLSGVVRDAEGRLHLVRQGVLHKNAQSERVDGQLFSERTGLSPVDVRIGAAKAKRSWFVVTALDLPNAYIRRNIGAFVDLCSLARLVAEAKEAKQDEERFDELFGKDEVGGETTGDPTLNKNHRRRIQGEVWLALQILLTADGRELLKPRHARGYEVDGEIATSSGKLLIEIKTGTRASDVYAGVGQLLLYPTLLPRLKAHRRILLLPGSPTEPLAEALRNCGIELHGYNFAIVGKKVQVDFSERFLKRCDLA
jgi:hypothetical protein